MQRFYIIADDLTGANDAGVQLSKIGISSTVFLDYNESSIKVAEGVAIIDTDSRAISEKAAYEKNLQASAAFHNQGYEHVYKKVDSTLRGNIAAELSAVVSVHRPEMVVIAPAFPKMNRQTMNGTQYVNGKPVSETEFGKDPKTPVKDSFIPHLFKKYVEDQVCLIDQTMLSETEEVLIEAIMERLARGKNWFVCDAKTDEDLSIIAGVFAKVKKSTVWAGSAGLIEHLPEALQLQKSEGIQQEEMAITRTLTVSASLSEVTKQQLEWVHDTMPDAYFIEINPVELIKQTYCLQDILDRFSAQSNKRHFVLFVESSEHNRKATKQLEAELSMGQTQISETIAGELGKMAEAIINAFSDIKGLVLTGGDTAKAVCNQLHMNRMQLITEVEVGLPLGKLSGETSDRLFWTVTKAGGFGNKQSLKNVLEYMSGKEEIV
jgi:D-threonate/D-erythronate kinase